MDLQVSWADSADIDRAIRNSTSACWTLIAAGERVVAVVLLSALFPLLVLVSIQIAILSRRCPLVAHRRVGQHGRELWVLKFRTMWGASVKTRTEVGLLELISEEGPAEVKQPKDKRITSRFAAICRKYSIDEIPQLWQVVRGEMALIGPRPLTSGELARYYGPHASQILAVKPGITGLWQVNGRSTLTLEERRELDLLMLNKWSVGLYCQILKATIPSVLSGRNAW